MSNRCECPRCGALELRSIRSWHEVNRNSEAVLWTEYRCEHCGHYEQMSRIDEDYDPSPDDQEDVTRIGGWG